MYKAFPLEICMCVFGTDFMDFEFWRQKKWCVLFQACAFGHGLHGLCFLKQKKSKGAWFQVCAFQHWLHGLWIKYKKNRRVFDFSKQCIRPFHFKYVCAFSARTSQTLRFKAKKKRGVWFQACAFRHGLRWLCFFKQKNQRVLDFRHVRFGTDFTDFAFLSKKKEGCVPYRHWLHRLWVKQG